MKNFLAMTMVLLIVGLTSGCTVYPYGDQGHYDYDLGNRHGYYSMETTEIRSNWRTGMTTHTYRTPISNSYRNGNTIIVLPAPEQQPKPKGFYAYGTLSTDTYLDSPNIPQECKTKNLGADGACLQREAEKLREIQNECVANAKNCPSNYNPGQLASIFSKLGQALSEKQAMLEQ